ncbi:MAG: hypothetical protein ABL872_11340 [Lacibacter sp.]
MKRIYFLLLFAVSLNSSAQNTQIVDTSFVNTSSKDFFTRNPVIEKVQFNIYADSVNYISVYPKTIWQDTTYKNSYFNNYESYDLSFIGDSYFFEKKYGRFPSPNKELAAASLNRCSKPSFIKCAADADSIKCRLEFNCPVKKEEIDEMVFTKVEILSGYKNGIKELQKKIETSYRNGSLFKKNRPVETALLFDIIIDNKDSCLKRIELKRGNYSPFAQFIMDELKTSCSWTPSEQGGRPVKSYTKIFIRLNKDNSITVAMPW